MDILTLLPGTVFELRFIRDRMNNGESFSQALESLQRFYDRIGAEQYYELLGVPMPSPYF